MGTNAVGEDSEVPNHRRLHAKAIQRAARATDRDAAADQRDAFVVANPAAFSAHRLLEVGRAERIIAAQDRRVFLAIIEALATLVDPP